LCLYSLQMGGFVSLASWLNSRALIGGAQSSAGSSSSVRRGGENEHISGDGRSSQTGAGNAGPRVGRAVGDRTAVGGTSEPLSSARSRMTDDDRAWELLLRMSATCGHAASSLKADGCPAGTTCAVARAELEHLAKEARQLLSCSVPLCPGQGKGRPPAPASPSAASIPAATAEPLGALLMALSQKGQKKGRQALATAASSTSSAAADSQIGVSVQESLLAEVVSGPQGSHSSASSISFAARSQEAPPASDLPVPSLGLFDEKAAAEIAAASGDATFNSSSDIEPTPAVPTRVVPRTMPAVFSANSRPGKPLRTSSESSAFSLDSAAQVQPSAELLTKPSGNFGQASSMLPLVASSPHSCTTPSLPPSAPPMAPPVAPPVGLPASVAPSSASVSVWAPSLPREPPSAAPQLPPPSERLGAIDVATSGFPNGSAPGVAKMVPDLPNHGGKELQRTLDNEVASLATNGTGVSSVAALSRSSSIDTSAASVGMLVSLPLPLSCCDASRSGRSSPALSAAPSAAPSAMSARDAAREASAIFERYRDVIEAGSADVSLSGSVSASLAASVIDCSSVCASEAGGDAGRGDTGATSTPHAAPGDITGAPLVDLALSAAHTGSSTGCGADVAAAHQEKKTTGSEIDVPCKILSSSASGTTLLPHTEEDVPWTYSFFFDSEAETAASSPPICE